MIRHEPVLTAEVLEMLDVKESGVYLDATAGGGGHSVEILRNLGAGGRLICTDRDEEALRRLRERFTDGRVTVARARFSDLSSVLGTVGVTLVDGILFDLGVSSFQLRDGDRGFSFESDARLDMRMDSESTLTAWHIVNRYPAREIADILWKYADERRSRRIARAVAEERQRGEISTCRQLADLVTRVCGGKRGKIHPATRTFQALRIAVNREPEELSCGLDQSVRLLGDRGRLCVISYHSLEDRIVKHFIREMSAKKVLAPVVKKPITASREEVRRNPSARSAKLRGAEKL